MTAFLRPLVMMCALGLPASLAAATFDRIASGAMEGHAVRISDRDGNVLQETATALVNAESVAELSFGASYGRAEGSFDLGVRTLGGSVEAVSTERLSWSFTQAQIDAAANAGATISLSLGFALGGSFLTVPEPAATPLGTTADLFVEFSDPVIANLPDTDYGIAQRSGGVSNLPVGVSLFQSTDAPNSYVFLPNRFVPEGLGTVEMANAVMNYGVELFAPQANRTYEILFTRKLSADSDGIIGIDFANSLTLVDVDVVYADGSEVPDFTDFTSSSGANLFAVAQANASAAAIPLPAAGWLLLTGLLGMTALRRTRARDGSARTTY